MLRRNLIIVGGGNHIAPCRAAASRLGSEVQHIMTRMSRGNDGEVRGMSFNKHEHNEIDWYARGQWLNSKKNNTCAGIFGDCLTLTDLMGMERLLEECAERGGPSFKRWHCPNRHLSKAYVKSLWEHGMRVPKTLIQEVAGWRRKVSRPGVWTSIEIRKGAVVSKSLMLDGVHMGADSNHVRDVRSGAPMVCSSVFEDDSEPSLFDFVVEKCSRTVR